MAAELRTVGHGTLPADELVDLVRGAGVEMLVDVRSYPGSRRNPQYGRDRMEEWVPESGVDYRWERRLGGRRPVRADSINVGLRNEAFRGYADHMATDEFAAGLERLLALAESRRVAVMCAEAQWWRCHRRLIADALVARGHGVLHVGSAGGAEPHELSEAAVVEDGGIVYPPRQTELDTG